LPELEAELHSQPGEASGMNSSSSSSQTRNSRLRLSSSQLESLWRVTPGALAHKLSKGRWDPRARHLQMLSQRLATTIYASMTQRLPGRLIVEMPPRHGKSTLISHYLPVWILENWPTANIILASYEADFAASWGRRARDTIQYFGPNGSEPLLHVDVDSRSAAGARWNTTAGGGMFTAGVGGPLTGKGANVLIIDDPVKNDKEANSELIREQKYEWFNSTAYTRLEPGGTVIIVMTRWHEDDLAGRLLTQSQQGSGEFWDEIMLPAIDDQGRALWPERFPISALERIRGQIGTYWWNALYQQRPQPAGGGTFKREHFRYFKQVAGLYSLDDADASVTRAYPESSITRFITVDLAASTKNTADYFVAEVWGLTPDRDLLLLDVLRTHVDGPEQLQHLRILNAKWTPGFIGIERQGYQLSLIQWALNAGLPVRGIDADRDKVSRALVMAARYEGHKVFHPLKADWLDEYEHELLVFPYGAHDDQVDAAAYAGIYASSNLFEGLFDYYKSLRARDPRPAAGVAVGAAGAAGIGGSFGNRDPQQRSRSIDYNMLAYISGGRRRGY
jgi:predicted phage terminase large subunit-like protein